MSYIDTTIIVVYLVAMVILGIYVGKGNESDDDYFAGGRSMPWFAIGFSTAATFMGASTFIGGPGWSYYDGILPAMLNFAVPIGVLYSNYCIHPIFYHHKITTIYEYQYKRFGTKTRIFSSLAWVLSTILALGETVYIPCLAMEAITGIDFDIWIPIIVGMAIFYTVAGGIKAVIWSDLVQCTVLIIGVVISI